MAYGEGGGYRAGGAPPRPAATKFDNMYPPSGDSEAAALYLKEIYRRRDVQPSIDEFTCVPQAIREEDKKEEQRLSKEFRNSGTEEGTVLEQFLICEMHRNDWLGGATFRTTKFDDYKGIDCVIEWDEADRFHRYPRLLVDVTTSLLPERVSQKQEKVLRGGDVKYFRSPFEQNEEGDEKELSLYGMPVVILGIEKTFLPKIAGMAKSQENGTVLHDGKRVRDIKSAAFQEHPLEVILLEQALAQVDIQVRDAAARMLNLEKTIGSSDAENVLNALRYRIGTGRISPDEMIQMIERILPALHSYSERNKGNAAVMSNVLAIPKWENIAAVYQLLSEKKASIDAKKNANQFLAARAWKNASVTHKLIMQKAA